MFCYVFFMARGWRPPHSWQGRCRPFPPPRPRTSSRPTSSSTCNNKRSYSAWLISPESALRQVWLDPSSTEDLLHVTCFVPESALHRVWLEPSFDGGSTPRNMFFPESALRRVWLEPSSTEDLLRVTCFFPESALRQVWLEPSST